MKRYFLIFAMASLMFLGISCDKDEDDDSFIVVDYEPDILINQYDTDTVFFDINLDGINDFKVYQKNSAPAGYRIFESVIDSSCVFSSVLYGDSINNTLPWQDEWLYVPCENSTFNNISYLAVKLNSDDGVNYGWLRPRIKVYSCNLYLVIDKAVYCKIKNKKILAGHERLD